MEILEGCQVGDALIVHSRYGTDLAVVERVTKFYVITDKGRFVKGSGREVGADRWNVAWAAKATTSDIERLSKERERRALVKKCESIAFERLAEWQLTKILEIAKAEEI